MAMSEARKEWYRKNRVHVRKVKKVWRDKNREKLRIERDIRRYGVAREVIFTRDNWTCQD